MFVFRVITINLGCTYSVHICALRSHVYIICIIFYEAKSQFLGLLTALYIQTKIRSNSSVVPTYNINTLNFTVFYCKPIQAYLFWYVWINIDVLEIYNRTKDLNDEILFKSVPFVMQHSVSTVSPLKSFVLCNRFAHHITLSNLCNINITEFKC